MEKSKKGHIDWFVFIATAGLMFMSVVFVSSASAGIGSGSNSYFMNHALKILAGIVIMLAFAMFDYHHWQKYSKWILIISVLALIIVLFAGDASKGATRWINLGFMRYQPSEVAKFAIIMHFSTMLVKNKANIKDFTTGFLPFLIWMSIVLVLIALQPNFSTMIVFFVLSIILLFIGNASIKHISATIGIGFIAALFYAFSASYRTKRILAFLGMSENMEHHNETAYQLNQSLLALGNGGWVGVGTGQSRQSHLFLPEAHTDFIFSIIGEEYGFIGLIAILLVFMFILFRGVKIVKNSPDYFGFLLGTGIIVTLSIYILINISVNIGLLPTTGLPLPFISYGGTAILINSAAIGILLNISAHSNVFPIEKKE